MIMPTVNNYYYYKLYRVEIRRLVNSSYKESRNYDAHLWLMLPKLSPSPNYAKCMQSIHNNNVASSSLQRNGLEKLSLDSVCSCIA